MFKDAVNISEGLLQSLITVISDYHIYHLFALATFQVLRVTAETGQRNRTFPTWQKVLLNKAMIFQKFINIIHLEVFHSYLP